MQILRSMVSVYTQFCGLSGVPRSLQENLCKLPKQIFNTPSDVVNLTYGQMCSVASFGQIYALS